jgi:formylglycine-generating enzyme required for sulfatase activity
MAAIFINYRKSQAAHAALAVHGRLSQEFGADLVFIDSMAIELGDDFVEQIELHLSDCQVMLTLIGDGWADAADDDGNRRFDDSDDYLLLELARAFEKRVRVVPVLIDGAKMPKKGQLPENLHPLLKRHALEVDFRRHVRQDLDALCADLRKLLRSATSSPLPKLAFDSVSGHLNATVQAPLPAKPAPKREWVSEPAMPPQMNQAAKPGIGKDGVSAPAVSPAGIVVDKPRWAVGSGSDSFGDWAELEVGGVRQRMRWIEPGEFLMGSPDTEAGRRENERPQHRVRLSQGFWLANTACTQALWLAVVGGKNPAKFRGNPNNPIENVTVDDALSFLTRLGEKLTSQPKFALPTEAQWEYACRAGTQTPFSFGEQITPDQVNYDGNDPYLSPKQPGKNGKYRGMTVPVKSLPPNAWGLYEMHGNVAECCADGFRPYDAEFVIDPTGAEGSGRAVRGGGWSSPGVGVRSAFRRDDGSNTGPGIGVRMRGRGFRFVVK